MKKSNIDIVFEICQTIMPEDLETKSRKRKYLYQRWIFWRVLQDLKFGYSLDAMGGYLGYDHATVLHSNKRFYLDVPSNEIYQNMFNECRDKCFKRFKMIDEVRHEINKKEELSDALYQTKIELEELKEQKEKLKLTIPRGTRRDNLLYEMLTLNEEQYDLFRERAYVMLKSVKTIRTYENTHKREFNAA